jgi:hypothetical protein
MERSEPTTSTKVALAGGFLLLGLLAVAVWLLVSASPASAQTDDTAQPDNATNAPESAATDQGAASEPSQPDRAAPDSSAPPPVDLRLPELPPLPIDTAALAPVVQPVTDVLQPVTDLVQPALQPVVSEVSELLPAPVRAPLAPVLSKLTPPPSSPSDTAPSATVVTDASVPPGPSPGAEPSGALAMNGRAASHSRNTGELRAADSSSQEGDTRAPPAPPPAVPALGNSVSNFSAGRDFGQGLWLLAVVAAGIMFMLGRGRRLLIEALGWSPTPWLALIERPG